MEMDKYYPFNSVGYDRTHDADDLAVILQSIMSDGVLYTTDTQLQAIATTDFNVRVNAGNCIVRGRIGANQTDKMITIAAPFEGIDRMDRVVIRVDYANRMNTLQYLQGVPAAAPEPPALRNDVDAYDMPLARIYVRYTAAAITQADITDERISAAPIVPSNISETLAQWRIQFDEWFDGVQDTLGEDVAGALLNLINDTNARLQKLPEKLTKLTITADTGLIGQTVTVTNGDLSYTVTIDETMTTVINIPQLDTWVISNSLTDKTVTVEIQYYGHYKVNVKAYREYGIRIDTNNSNPATCCSYIGEAPAPGSAEWDTWFGMRPCLFKNGAVVGYLDPDNFAKFEDGSPADITSGTAGDVMIEFPRRGLSIITIGSNISIMLTDDEELTGYEHNAHRRGNVQKENFYFSAYKGSVTDNKLRSLSGKTPSSNLTIGGYRNYAHANGIGYEISAFYQILYIQALYILKYANLNSQVTIGKGRTAAVNTAAIATGGTDASGMTWGGTDGQHMKLFGIEDFWGNIWDWFDGAVTNSARNLLIATDDFNDGGSGYSNQGLMYSANISSAFISKVFGTTDAGFMPNLATGSETTYFCDGVWLSPSRVAKHGGGWNDAGRAGAFCVTLDDSSSTAAPYVGARLSFI